MVVCDPSHDGQTDSHQGRRTGEQGGHAGRVVEQVGTDDRQAQADCQSEQSDVEGQMGCYPCHSRAALKPLHGGGPDEVGPPRRGEYHEDRDQCDHPNRPHRVCAGSQDKFDQSLAHDDQGQLAKAGA